MNILQIQNRIAWIKTVSLDYEMAHYQEDDLYIDFVRAVSKWEIEWDIQELAKEILKTRRIKFPRYCA